MFPEPFADSLVLTGPTGSGKTRIALEASPRLNAEIIAMDSMTLFRGMDIGTAKPTLLERQQVPHHLIDVLDPWEPASVAWWLAEAARCCRNVRERGKRPLFVGGTPLYLKALLHGLFESPPSDPEIRRRLTHEADELGAEALHERLRKVDSAAGHRLHPNDLHRIVRALEVWELTGQPISSLQTQWQVQDRQAQGSEHRSSSDLGPWALDACLWIDIPRARLYERINERVANMIRSGWIEEARALRGLPNPLGQQASQALGYREIFDYLDGQSTLEETIAVIQTRSRNFAKRQLTWFRRLASCRPLRKELTIGNWQLTIE